jgi:hypothetical protein
MGRFDHLAESDAWRVGFVMLRGFCNLRALRDPRDCNEKTCA